MVEVGYWLGVVFVGGVNYVVQINVYGVCVVVSGLYWCDVLGDEYFYVLVVGVFVYCMFLVVVLVGVECCFVGDYCIVDVVVQCDGEVVVGVIVVVEIDYQVDLVYLCLFVVVDMLLCMWDVWWLNVVEGDCQFFGCG